MDGLENKAMQHLKQLCVDIGPRPSGSAGNHAAATYIRDVFQSAGLEVEEQRYDCPAWEHEETYLAVYGQPLAAAANAFSPSCDVVAPVVTVGTVAELEGAELTGRIGLLYGDLTRSPLAPKAWFLKTERDEHIVQLLEEKAPAALITVQAQPGDLNRLIEDAEFHIPSATVNAQVGLVMLQQRSLQVHLRIKSQRSAGSSCNVVGRKAGANQERIVICAHYDTKIDTPGAGDNGAGVAGLLTLAQLLSQRPSTFGLEWVAFSSEESLPLGDDEYVRRCGDCFDQMVTAINIDGVGQTVGSSSLTMMASSPEFQNHVAGLTQAYPGIVWVDPWPESNHSTFVWRGVPSLAFGSTAARNFAHLRTDTIDWISPAKLGEVVSVITDIVESLQDKSLAWYRERSTQDN
jgi:Iap family predicted aminopeptidase